jgi:hypothetical protein
MNLVESIFAGTDESNKSPLPAGSAKWSRADGKIQGIIFVCPCGCRQIRCVPVLSRLAGSRSAGPRGWTWDGNETSPTLTSSILIVGECGWHGYLTKGEWVKC